MATAALVQVKVDSDVKEDVSRIYENLGLDLPTAIRIFFKKKYSRRWTAFWTSGRK